MSKKNTKARKNEYPFEKLKTRDGKLFDKTIVRNWYIAHEYVRNRLKDVRISPTSSEALKVVIEIDNDNKNLMLAVVRQVALFTHYPNYVEHDKFGHTQPETRSVIKIVSKDQDIANILKREEYLNNLLVYCQYKRNGVEQNKPGCLIPIDLDIDIVDTYDEQTKESVIRMTASDVQCYKDAGGKGIDTEMAVLSSRVYEIGAEIDNLPYEDIHDANRYYRALTIFEHKILSRDAEALVSSKWDNNQIEVKTGLSNIFCADRFESLERSMDLAYEKMRDDYCEKCSKGERNNCDKRCDKEKKNKCKKNKVTIESCWEKYDYELAVSEHARWIAEKLILGFRPMNPKERARYECLLGNQRKAYAKLLKGDSKALYEKFPEDYENKNIDPTHVNLCTFKELRRIDPDSRRYDSFLMLAIPKILEKTQR